MKVKNYSNPNQLIRIEVHPKTPNHFFEYREEATTLLGLFQILPAGWSTGLRHGLSDEYVYKFYNNNVIIEDKQLYLKPRVILRYPDNIKSSYYFDTYNEAKEFVLNRLAGEIKDLDKYITDYSTLSDYDE
jgi:hypothetical protein